MVTVIQGSLLAVKIKYQKRLGVYLDKIGKTYFVSPFVESAFCGNIVKLAVLFSFLHCVYYCGYEVRVSASKIMSCAQG